MADVSLIELLKEEIREANPKVWTDSEEDQKRLEQLAEDLLKSRTTFS
jgi:hypothetical protein